MIMSFIANSFVAFFYFKNYNVIFKNPSLLNINKSFALFKVVLYYYVVIL